jgi:hypothetical protein
MITLELTIEEANIILRALGASPYSEVSALVPRIVKIGNEAVAAKEAELAHSHD